MTHIDPAWAPLIGSFLGSMGGVVTVGKLIRDAKLGDLRADIEKLGKELSELTIKYGVLQVNLEEEHRKVGMYFGQASDFKDENIALRRVIQAKDEVIQAKEEKISALKDELRDIDKNIIKGLK